jgi:hypothetical protein
MAAVPTAPAPLYDPFEREVLRDALRAAAVETKAEAASVAARLAGADAVGAPPLPPPPAVPPVVPDLPPPAAQFSLEDNLVAAEGLVELAQAVGRDRLELARRASILEGLDAPGAPAFVRVGVLVFPPGATRLTERERVRLDRALAQVRQEHAPVLAWRVRTGGPLAEARAAAVRSALEARGVPADVVTTARLERDVAVAEIAVRR